MLVGQLVKCHLNKKGHIITGLPASFAAAYPARTALGIVLKCQYQAYHPASSEWLVLLQGESEPRSVIQRFLFPYEEHTQEK